MNIPNDTDTDNRILKHKRMIRKSSINILAWLENNPSPTDEDIVMLKALQAKLRDSILYYAENIKDWEKRTTTIELPQPVLDHQAYLDTGISVDKEE